MQETKKNPYRLLTPGPVPLHPEVEKIMGLPMIHHRTPEFELCLKSVSEKLKETFSTSQPVFIHTSSGTGAMESALVNTLSPGDEIICIDSGKFGERWAKIAESYGLKVHILKVEWGFAVTMDQVEAALKAHSNIKAVLCQACETSTATVHPIKAIAHLIAEASNKNSKQKSHNEIIFIVDAITAVGAMPLEMDEWGLDVVIGGSQKAFMLPAGLSFIALSQKAWRFNEKSRCPRFYWDLKSEKNSLLKGETHFSSAVPLIRALDFALNFLSGSKKSQTLSRINLLAETTREIAKIYGLKIFSHSPSPSVTALVMPENMDSQKLREHIEKKYNLTVMGGQDQLKGKILRIGHLGYITNEDMLAFCEILYHALKEFSMSSLNADDLQAAKKLITQKLNV